MKKLYIALFCVLGAASLSYSQSCHRSKVKDARTDLGKVSHDHIKTQPANYVSRANRRNALNRNSNAQFVGNPYLHENFYAGTVALQGAKEKPSHFEKMRFNAFTNTLEITAGGKVSYVQGGAIRQFTLKQSGSTRTFINTQAYTGTPKPLFIEMLEDGSLQLARGLIVKIEKPAYGSQANARPQRPKLARSMRFYLVKNKQLHLIKRKKDLYKFFAKTQLNAKSFVKKYRTKLKTKDLKHLVKHYNGLSTSTSPKVIAKSDQK
ncbi:hypothetical protein BKI52_00375 [marine bacterium AO1-C]|nr:hypothetical protein BKI52_00375 [marine bacterium AO1-C]